MRTNGSLQHRMWRRLRSASATRVVWTDVCDAVCDGLKGAWVSLQSVRLTVNTSFNPLTSNRRETITDGLIITKRRLVCSAF